MSRIPTGKRYEASGPVASIRKVWPFLEKADPNAVFISASSDDVSSIGTDDRNAAMSARQSCPDSVVFVDTLG
jgi:pantothenate kinase type III